MFQSDRHTISQYVWLRSEKLYILDKTFSLLSVDERWRNGPNSCQPNSVTSRKMSAYWLFQWLIEIFLTENGINWNSRFSRLEQINVSCTDWMLPLSSSGGRLWYLRYSLFDDQPLHITRAGVICFNFWINRNSSRVDNMFTLEVNLTFKTLTWHSQRISRLNYLS